MIMIEIKDLKIFIVLVASSSSFAPIKKRIFILNEFLIVLDEIFFLPKCSI